MQGGLGLTDDFQVATTKVQQSCKLAQMQDKVPPPPPARGFT